MANHVDLTAFMSNFNIVTTNSGNSAQTAKELTFLRLSIQHEEQMALLYEVLRVQLPKSDDLWRNLSVEELGHARRLKNLYDLVAEGNASLDPDRPSLTALENSLHSLHGKIKMWRVRPPSQQEAFEYALLLEGGIVEDRYFSPRQKDSDSAKSVFYEMKTQSCNHFERVRQEYARMDLGAGFINHLKASMKALFITTEKDRDEHDGLPSNAPKTAEVKFSPKDD